ncbi:hypothetical protein BAY61_17140 [Prauserella marina]|uniref:Uncharacterized protein n=1 Tax=Prauserella marina TaxID=530584 RepID=A0A222VR89_9PSEU|nr:hypothetical protein [Prauserella marina]ASR36446.1 hypothetical protein BAY61_17140 [Prauserella marina]PWV77259.1 hypothetical protein DES30_105476 [Prauserella marina]SDD08036.1 hypothetical protein SAMN05421630_105477 [Prauserella marina]
MPNTRPVAAYVLATLSSLGLAVAIAGAFLPWFYSGAVERNSFQAVGLVDHFELLDNAFAAPLLRGWVALPLISTVCVALYALRILRTAAAIVTVLSLLIGTVAALALVQGSGEAGMVGVTTIGPLITATGMTIALVAALGVFGTARGKRTGSAANTGAGVQP